MVLNTSWCSETRRTFDSNFFFFFKHKGSKESLWISESVPGCTSSLSATFTFHLRNSVVFLPLCPSVTLSLLIFPPRLSLSLSPLLFIFCQMTAASQDKRQARQERRSRGRMRYEDGEETARVRMTERRGASGVIESRRWRQRRERGREGQMDGLNRLACVIRGGKDSSGDVHWAAKWLLQSRASASDLHKLMVGDLTEHGASGAVALRPPC